MNLQFTNDELPLSSEASSRRQRSRRHSSFVLRSGREFDEVAQKRDTEHLSNFQTHRRFLAARRIPERTLLAHTEPCPVDLNSPSFIQPAKLGAHNGMCHTLNNSNFVNICLRCGLGDGNVNCSGHGGGQKTTQFLTLSCRTFRPPCTWLVVPVLCSLDAVGPLVAFCSVVAPRRRGPFLQPHTSGH